MPCKMTRLFNPYSLSIFVCEISKLLLFGINIHNVISILYLGVFLAVPQDGLRLLIQFANHGEYELDANTLDEKNKVIGVLY